MGHRFFLEDPQLALFRCAFFEAGVVDQEGFQCTSASISLLATAKWFVCLPVLSFCGLLYTIQLNCHRHARILRGNLLTMNSHSKYLDDQWNSETPHYKVCIYICSMRLSIISYMHICLDYIYIIFIHTYMSTIQWTYSIFDSRLHDMIWYDLILIFSHLCVWIWLYIYTYIEPGLTVADLAGNHLCTWAEISLFRVQVSVGQVPWNTQFRIGTLCSNYRLCGIPFKERKYGW